MIVEEMGFLITREIVGELQIQLKQKYPTLLSSDNQILRNEYF